MEGKHKQAGDKRKAVNTTKSTPNPFADKLAPTSHTCAVRLRVRENNTFYAICFPLAWPVLSESSRCFSEVGSSRMCENAHLCMHACTYVAACPVQCQQTKNTHTHKKKKQQFKDLIPLPSAQQTRPSQEKQIDRRHEMIGEEFDGKKVRFPPFSKQAALPL